MSTLSVFVILPFIFAFLQLVASNRIVQYGIGMLFGLVMGALALFAYSNEMQGGYIFSMGLEYGVIAADIALLLFFVREGVRWHDKKVAALALLQLLLYIGIEISAPAAHGVTLIVDLLSLFMFVIINAVGGIIVFYAVGYMRREEGMSEFRRRLFVVYLMLFVAVMNAIVMANDLLLFFFLFELTTLASYLLIRFRGDETSRNNALRALWMNQVGGVAILLGIVVGIGVFGTHFFDLLLTSGGEYLLLCIALLSMAALVKGASLPFDGWLLGAMVAPTPVSAMLHSATMVKIAPFMIIKFSAVLGGTLLGGMLSMIGAAVFVAATYLALSKTMFKELLGYSTIALLGLMMSLAALGSEAGVKLAMMLMLFHALSKALLFLVAGVLEKSFHVKSLETMRGIGDAARAPVLFILFGFASLTLPPFGLFMGKLFAIELLAGQIVDAPWLLAVLLAAVIGSVLMTLLYFKVASALFARQSDARALKSETLPWDFSVALWALTLLIVGAAGVLIGREMSLLYLGIPLVVIFGVLLLNRWLRRFDRSGEYRCGEKAPFDAALLYFDSGRVMNSRLRALFAFLFAAVAAAGVIA